MIKATKIYKSKLKENIVFRFNIYYLNPPSCTANENLTP